MDPLYTMDYLNFPHQREIAKPVMVIEPTDEASHKKARALLGKIKERVARPNVPIAVGIANVKIREEGERVVAVLPSGLKLIAPSREVLLKGLESYGYYAALEAIQGKLS